MISYLSGTVKFIEGNDICLLTGGVGYKIEIPLGDLYKEKEIYEIYIYTLVREDSIRLFGFKDRQALDLFSTLLSVSGVGPKAALALLSIGSDNLIQAIQTNTLNEFKIKGMGPKTIEKIQFEMKDKFKDFKISNLEQQKTQNNRRDIDSIFTALENLGFKNSEIEEALKMVDNDILVTNNSSLILKQVLKNLRKK